MLEDLTKIIDESIAIVTKDDIVVEGKEDDDRAFELAKSFAKMGVKEHLQSAGVKARGAVKKGIEELKDKAVEAAGKAKKGAEDLDIKGHLAAAGKKVVEKGKEAVEGIKEHPGKAAAATAAALAAGIGGVAVVKRMRKAAKKK